MRHGLSALAVLVGLAVLAAAAVAVGGAGAARTAASTTTTTTLTQPQVSALPSAAPPASRLPGHGRPQIVVGDMNTTEQFVIGDLYLLALRNRGYSARTDPNIGPVQLTQQALRQHLLSVYPQYIDPLYLRESWDGDVAHLGRRFGSAARAYAAGSAYALEHGFELLTATPGSDTAGLAVTTQFARENHVASLAQLARVARLTFGIPQGFTGLAGAERAYRFEPGAVDDVFVGAQYEDLEAGQLQVAYVSTTDPELSGPDFTLLRDPRHVYGFGNIVPVTTPAVVRAEGPAFVRTIDRVDALLTTAALRGLSSEVLVDGHQPLAVAADFLEGNGLLPAPRYKAAG